MKSLHRTMQQMGSRYYIYVISIVLMAVLKSLLDIMTSYFVNHIYGYFESAELLAIPGLFMKYFITGIMIIFIWRFFTIIYNNEAKRAAAHIQKKIYAKSLRLPLFYYEGNNSGDLISRLSFTIDKACDIYGSRYRRVLTPVISVIVYVIAMCMLNLWMTSILLMADVILLAITIFFNIPMKRINQKVITIKKEEVTSVLNIINGLETVKIYHLSTILYEKYQRIINRWKKEWKLEGGIIAILDGFNTGFDLLCSLVFIVIGLKMMQIGMIEIGELMGIYVLYTSFNYHFLQIGRYIPEITECLVYMDELFEFLDQPEEKVSEDSGVQFELKNDVPVKIDNISFGYDDNDMLIQNLSMQFYANSETAVIGRSGCGKSTLFKLMLDFYPLNNGDIYLYGNSLRTMETFMVRELITYIPQETYLYNASIIENISYGRAGASYEELILAAKSAHAHDFIMKQPNGYDTLMQNGGRNLSGGERQRIAIARAILKNSPIILMDETTSALDNVSEREINKFISEAKINKTIIIIAHKEETISNADFVIPLCNKEVMPVTC